MHTVMDVLRPRRAALGPPSDASRGLFGAARGALNDHPLVTDGIAAGALLTLSTVWLVLSPFAGAKTALFQIALVVPLVWRRSHPAIVFVLIAVVALLEWVLGSPLIADASLLVALYTVAVHDSRVRTLVAAAVLEVGAVLAATRWHPAGTLLRSLAFLTATVVAALFAGLTVRSGSEYMAWLAERAARLEIERDQQASIAAAEERTRIAREMHDIVAHSLSVVITLLDAASVVNRSDPERAADAMLRAADVGRQALGDMRTMIGVLRTDTIGAELVPQPGLTQLESLLGSVRATGLAVTVEVQGQPFALGAAAELTAYRIVQESLTNTIKHASATSARVVLRYDRPVVTVHVTDDGPAPVDGPRRRVDEVGKGHGINGMRERAGLHRGTLEAGPVPGGGWAVVATLRPDTAPVKL
jgi:signal transduction histidine kinase